MARYNHGGGCDRAAIEGGGEKNELQTLKSRASDGTGTSQEPVPLL